METNQTPIAQAGIRPERPPTTPTYFDQAEGQPAVDRVIFALKGVCDAMNREQQHCGDFEQMNRIANLATAAAILADQLHDRLTFGPHPRQRRKPKLTTVLAGVPGGAA